VSSYFSTALAVLVLLTIGILVGCGRSEPSLLWVNYECEFLMAVEDQIDSDVTQVRVGINLGTGRSIVSSYDVLINVDAVADAGRLLLRYPGEPGRKLVIGPDGKAVLTEPKSPGAPEMRDFDGKCKKL